MGFYPLVAPPVSGPSLAIAGNASIGGSLAAGPLGLPTLEQVAATPAAGVALTGATPTFLTWTSPNDGNLHLVILFMGLQVTTLQVGGAVSFNWTEPSTTGGTPETVVLFAGGLAVGQNWTTQLHIVPPNTTVTYTQSSAQTSGAAQTWASLLAA